MGNTGRPRIRGSTEGTGERGKNSKDRSPQRHREMQDRRGVPALRQHTPDQRETVRLGIYRTVDWMGGAQRGESDRDQGRQVCTGSISVVQRDIGGAEEPKGVQECLGVLGFRGRSGDPKVAQGPPISYLPWQCLAGGCPSLAPGPRAGRTQPGQAGAPCGNKRRCWGTRGVTEGQAASWTSHLVRPGERTRAVRFPNVQA